MLLLLQVLRVGEALLATQQAQLLPELLRVAGESADTPGVQLLQVPGPTVSDMQSFMRPENIVRKSKFVPGAMGVARAAGWTSDQPIRLQHMETLLFVLPCS